MDAAQKTNSLSLLILEFRIHARLVVMGLPPSLHRSLATTNLVESRQSGARKRTGNVCRWRDADMVLR